LDTIAAALLAVKAKERFTYQDMADIMGCSDETVANAARGSHVLGGYYLDRAKAAWPDAFKAVAALGVRA
jgi:cyanate lyase